MKTIKTRVSNTNTLIGKLFPEDKCPGFDPEIRFYELEDYDKSDSGDKTLIHVKIDKSKPATKYNITRLILPVIKYFYHQGPRVARVIRETMGSVYKHLVITTWKGIYQSWMYVEKVMKGPALNKLRKPWLSWKELLSMNMETIWV